MKNLFKKFALVLAIAMVFAAMPMNAFAAEPTMNGGILVPEHGGEAAVCFEMLNLSTTEEHTYRAELYSGDTFLTFKEKTMTAADGILTCSFYTVGTSSSWTQNSWTAVAHLVPTHAVFYIDGNKVCEDPVDFAASEWATFDGVKSPYMDGGILVDRTATDNEAALYFEMNNLPTGEAHKYTAKLYAGDKYLTFKEITLKSEGSLGCSFYTVGTSSSWTQDSWTANDFTVPTHADFYIDDVFVCRDAVDFATESEWVEFPGTSAPYMDGGILVDRIETDNEAAVYFEMQNLPTSGEYTYRAELFADDTFLTYKEITLKSDGILGCSFYTVGTSSSWAQDNWTAYDHVIPTKAVFYINGVKVCEDAVDFAASEWAPFPGTVKAEHEHVWSSNMMFDAAAHWNYCYSCGAQGTVSAHSDANADGYCECGWMISAAPSRVNPNTGVTAEMIG